MSQWLHSESGKTNTTKFKNVISRDDPYHPNQRYALQLQQPKPISVNNLCKGKQLLQTMYLVWTLNTALSLPKPLPISRTVY
jgi:hypothetical protein